MPTKLGAHVLRDSADLDDFIQARPAVIKFVTEWGKSAIVHPNTLVIGAKAGDYDATSQRKAGQTPREAAEQFVEDMLETYQSNPLIKYWEGHNEPVWNDEGGMGWYAQFEVERMKLMAEHGLKCVIGNFATGTPPLELWSAFVPALRVAMQYEAILGLHEYSCPWMWWMTGKHQLDPDDDQGDEGWTTLRYRKVYRKYLIPKKLGDVPLVITETGIDPLVNPKPPGVTGGTWKQLGGFWAEHDNEPDKADYYFRQLVWYDEELQKDDYVVGATIFTWGNWGGTWKQFDVGGTNVSKKLIAYTEENPSKPFKYPKVGDGDGDGDGGDGDDGSGGDAEDKSRGDPRVQYERTYVLLPPDANSAWAQAVAEGAWDKRRYTIGGSADDAGIGDLDVRNVIAVNPQNWPGALSLEEFFEQHYPGVKYRSIKAATPKELVRKLSEE